MNLWMDSADSLTVRSGTSLGISIKLQGEAPYCSPAEMGNIFWKSVRCGRQTKSQAEAALGSLQRRDCASLASRNVGGRNLERHLFDVTRLYPIPRPIGVDVEIWVLWHLRARPFYLCAT